MCTLTVLLQTLIQTVPNSRRFSSRLKSTYYRRSWKHSPSPVVTVSTKAFNKFIVRQCRPSGVEFFRVYVHIKSGIHLHGPVV